MTKNDHFGARRPSEGRKALIVKVVASCVAIALLIWAAVVFGQWAGATREAIERHYGITNQPLTPH